MGKATNKGGLLYSIIDPNILGIACFINSKVISTPALAAISFTFLQILGFLKFSKKS